MQASLNTCSRLPLPESPCRHLSWTSILWLQVEGQGSSSGQWDACVYIAVNLFLYFSLPLNYFQQEMLFPVEYYISEVHVNCRTMTSIKLRQQNNNNLTSVLSHIFFPLFFVLHDLCPFSFNLPHLSDQGFLWLDQSLQVHIQDRPVTEKVTESLFSSN